MFSPHRSDSGSALTTRRPIIIATLVLAALCANVAPANEEAQTGHVAKTIADSDPDDRHLRLAVAGLSAVGAIGLLLVRRNTTEP